MATVGLAAWPSLPWISMHARDPGLVIAKPALRFSHSSPGRVDPRSGDPVGHAGFGRYLLDPASVSFHSASLSFTVPTNLFVYSVSTLGTDFTSI